MRNHFKRLRAGSLPLTKRGRVARAVERLVRNKGCYDSHIVTMDNGKKVERIDYYPKIYYRKYKQDNMFAIKIRMDNPHTEKLRDCQQVLADMFSTVCVKRIGERGYLTYCFELKQQEQTHIKSCSDIPNVGECEIAFSQDIIWNWKKCPHLLLTGNTGSGKSQLAQYIIACLLKQGVRVIYCDPKNDDDMHLFMRNYPSVKYITTVNEIAKVVRETEEEVRSREQDLHNIGIEEAEFNPVFLMFDELIAFSKIADKKSYDETAKRLASIIVIGRSKRVFAGLILQRPDTSFIEGAIRDNLNCRIAMGQMSDMAYKMVFGSDFSDVKNHRQEIGSGLIFRQSIDTVPREFLVPYIEKGALSKME